MIDVFARRAVFGAALAAGLALAGPAGAASFDCAAAHHPDEAAICASRALSEQDVRMDTLYGVLTRLVGMGERADIADAQRAFLAKRAGCSANIACLASAYDARIAALEAALGRIYARGPF